MPKEKKQEKTEETKTEIICARVDESGKIIYCPYNGKGITVRS